MDQHSQISASWKFEVQMLRVKGFSQMRKRGLRNYVIVSSTYCNFIVGILPPLLFGSF